MSTEKRDGAGLGTAAAFATYGMWGLFPLYWKQLSAVPPVQILAHRILWALVFALGLLAATRKLPALRVIFRDRKRALAVAASGVLITANWGTYIWAINTGHITESSLGYYINPLVSVALGSLFFREKLDRWTAAAVCVAAVGVTAASIMMGAAPGISLVLAFTFGLYGAVKKKAALGPSEGLAAETLVVAPLALAYLLLEARAGRGAFGGPSVKVNLMLVLGGIVTAVPLLAFAFAANRIPLQRMGFIQYLSPSLQLALGLVVYGERISPPMAVAFATVIAAVILYATTRGRVAGGRAKST